ncbi:hypothetical protein VB713_19905, partial [Anabaena cylindrica UHCC 0172]|uniref:hypothetical protein n=1 Tax=Anabaena cylindrica TaxID=1165 RepID=UPI002B1FBFE9
MQLNPREISFPSSISAQQLFNLYDFSFHTSSSTSTNTINSTAKTLWSTLFDPTNPFNLTLQITDLPTGQLAEAQITNYDQYGRPNSGTILIDNDANATVQDKSEETGKMEKQKPPSNVLKEALVNDRPGTELFWRGATPKLSSP